MSLATDLDILFKACEDSKVAETSCDCLCHGRYHGRKHPKSLYEEVLNRFERGQKASGQGTQSNPLP